MARFLLLAVILACSFASVGPARAQVEPVKKLDGHTGAVMAIAGIPNSNELASAGVDGKVIIWDLKTGEKAATFIEHDGALYALAISSDGKMAASAGVDGVIRLWSIKNGKTNHALKVGKDRTAALAFSKDGSKLVSGGYDGVIRIWDVAKGTELKRFKKLPSRVTGLAFLGDGTRLLSCGVVSTEINRPGFMSTTGLSDPFKLWDVAEGKELRSLDARSHVVAASADGKIVLGAGLEPDYSDGFDNFDQVRRVDPDSGKPVYTIRWRGSALALASNAKWIATGEGHMDHFNGLGYTVNNNENLRKLDTRIRLWDAKTGVEQFRLEEREATVLSFSSDSRYLAAGTSAGTIRVWALDRLAKKP